MKSIAFSIEERLKAPKPKEKSKITNQRQEIIKMFLDRLNASREASGFKPLTPAFVGVRLRFLKSCSELRQFYGYCDEAKNFSSTWWWATNPKNFPDQPSV